MKHIIFLLMLPCAALSQPKKTNTIEVKNTSLADGVRHLISQAYMIDKIDTAYGYAYSKPKGVKGEKITINLTQKDSSLLIAGVGDMQMTVNAGLFSSSASTFPIEYKGAKGSPLRKCWDELHRFAQSFGKEMVYSTR